MVKMKLILFQAKTLNRLYTFELFVYAQQNLETYETYTWGGIIQRNSYLSSSGICVLRGALHRSMCSKWK